MGKTEKKMTSQNMLIYELIVMRLSFTRSGKENDLISFPTCPESKYSIIRLDCKSD